MGAAIDQVLETDYGVDEVELVVIDEGSTDGAADLRVTIVSHERNAGEGGRSYGA